MKPTIGRIVHLFPNESCARDIHARSRGNSVATGEPLAAVIVRVWSDTCVNVKIITDGPDDVWSTSISQRGTYGSPGECTVWDWPDRESA